MDYAVSTAVIIATEEVERKMMVKAEEEKLVIAVRLHALGIATILGVTEEQVARMLA